MALREKDFLKALKLKGKRNVSNQRDGLESSIGYMWESVRHLTFFWKYTKNTSRHALITYLFIKELHFEI